MNASFFLEQLKHYVQAARAHKAGQAFLLFYCSTLEGFPWELRTPEPREGLCVSLLGDPQDHATFCLPTLQEVLSLSPESCVIMVLPPAPAYILICSSYMNGSFMGRDPPLS